MSNATIHNITWDSEGWKTFQGDPHHPMNQSVQLTVLINAKEFAGIDPSKPVTIIQEEQEDADGR